MSQADLGIQGNKDYEEYFRILSRFFNRLKKQGKLNPNFKSFLPELDKRIWYFDQVRTGTDLLDFIIRDKEGKTFDVFLEKTKDFHMTQTGFMQIFSSLLIYNFLIYYGNVETLFLSLLKDARYGEKKDQIINGGETLGQLLPKIFKLDDWNTKDKKIIESIIDTNFRNALAHGWIRIENHQLRYFETPLETTPHIVDEIELLGRLINLKIFGRALSHLILAGNWED